MGSVDVVVVPLTESKILRIAGYVAGSATAVTEYKNTFKQILSTFNFTDRIIPTNSSQIKTSKKLTYLLPAGWYVAKDSSLLFEIGYNPATHEVKYENGISLIRKNLANNQYYSTYANTTTFTIKTYNNGSRHEFINKELGEPISSMNKSPDFKEIDYIIGNKNCLVFKGVSISQYPTVWGMCPLTSAKALLFSTFDNDIESTLQTLTFK
jgi:hypothetical protein